MTELLRILQLAGNDFSYFFRTKWLMAVLLSLNLSDMLVVALVFQRLMDFNYFQFLPFAFRNRRTRRTLHKGSERIVGDAA